MEQRIEYNTLRIEVLDSLFRGKDSEKDINKINSIVDKITEILNTKIKTKLIDEKASEEISKNLTVWLINYLYENGLKCNGNTEEGNGNTEEGKIHYNEIIALRTAITKKPLPKNLIVPSDSHLIDIVDLHKSVEFVKNADNWLEQIYTRLKSNFYDNLLLGVLRKSYPKSLKQKPIEILPQVEKTLKNPGTKPDVNISNQISDKSDKGEDESDKGEDESDINKLDEREIGMFSDPFGDSRGVLSEQDISGEINIRNNTPNSNIIFSDEDRLFGLDESVGMVVEADKDEIEKNLKQGEGEVCVGMISNSDFLENPKYDEKFEEYFGTDDYKEKIGELVKVFKKYFTKMVKENEINPVIFKSVFCEGRYAEYKHKIISHKEFDILTSLAFNGLEVKKVSDEVGILFNKTTDKKSMIPLIEKIKSAIKIADDKGREIFSPVVDRN